MNPTKEKRASWRSLAAAIRPWDSRYEKDPNVEARIDLAYEARSAIPLLLDALEAEESKSERLEKAYQARLDAAKELTGVRTALLDAIKGYFGVPYWSRAKSMRAYKDSMLECTILDLIKNLARERDEYEEAAQE